MFTPLFSFPPLCADFIFIVLLFFSSYQLLTSQPGAVGLILLLVLPKLHYWLLGRETSVLHRAAHSALHRIFYTPDPQLNANRAPHNRGN